MRSVHYINDKDGTKSEIFAYKKSKVRRYILYIFYILTAFLLKLFLFWFKHLFIKITCKRTTLSTANCVLIRDSNGIYFIEEVGELRVTGMPVARYFFYKKLKYLYNEDSGIFELIPPYDEIELGTLRNCQPLSETQIEQKQKIYSKNFIDAPLDSHMHLLLHQALNPFYVFQICSCILWFLDNYYTYACCILIISLASLIYQIHDTRKNQLALYNTVTSTSNVKVTRHQAETSENKAYTIPTSDLVPGDIIHIPPQGCTMYCDALILSGNCIVNESSLTGESLPITKVAHQFRGILPFISKSDTAMSQKELELAEQADKEIFDIETYARSVLYSGTNVIQTRNHANEDVYALVLRTGFYTARGEMVRSILFPKPIKFKFDNDAYRFVGVLSIFALIGFIYTIVIRIQQHGSVKEIILKALDLITIVVPPALPLAMTVGTMFAQTRLKDNQIFCVQPSVVNLCGVINVCCFDKTGTLTEEGLDLWGIIPADETSGKFKEPLKNPSSLKEGPLIESLAACHSITRIAGELSGDPLDVKMFLSTDWELIEETNEDNHKFQMTVPVIVRPLGQFENGTELFESANILNDSDPLPYEVGILRQFPFSSSLQRMSVISRVLNKTHFSVYTKGSPEILETMCRADTIPSNYHEILLDYTKEGYRVLAIAWRPLRLSYTKMMKLPRETVEKKLLFLGLIVMENRLKPETAPVIKELKRANIRTVMVTGDNMLTALSVARDSEIIDEYDKVIIVNAHAPPLTEAENEESKNEKRWEHLVEFHYAEDLQRPVVEVTTMTTQKKADRNFQSAHEGVGFSRPKQGLLSRIKNLTKTGFINSETEHVMRDESDTLNASPEGDNPRLNIRMLDRPNFHLAISGKTWGIIKDYFPWLIPKLVVKGTVFARFSPDQKHQLIEALQSVGYYVSMCGDGANDCGALKAAHAGISLNEAEASIASHFTSKRQNISCIPTVIKEGRCALVTSFGTFKFMLGYSIVEFFSCIMLYSISSSLGDFQFLYIDLFLITTLGISFGYTKAHEELCVEPPPMRLVSVISLLSIFTQLFICIFVQLGAYLFIQSRNWYISLIDLDYEEYEILNFDNTTIFLASVFQYIFLAIIFSKGAPYRKNILSNYFFLANIAVAFIVTVYLTTWPADVVMYYFELIRYPEFSAQVCLILMVFAGFLLGICLDEILDGVSFRKRIRRLRKILFYRYIQPKDYERINEEIEKMVHVWPPLIRSASVQDIRADVFLAENQSSTQKPPIQAISKRLRHLSSCGDYNDESDSEPNTISKTNKAYEGQNLDENSDAKSTSTQLRRSRSLDELTYLGNSDEVQGKRLIVAKRLKNNSSSRDYHRTGLNHSQHQLLPRLSPTTDQMLTASTNVVTFNLQDESTIL